MGFLVKLPNHYAAHYFFRSVILITNLGAYCGQVNVSIASLLFESFRNIIHSFLTALDIPETRKLGHKLTLSCLESALTMCKVVDPNGNFQNFQIKKQFVVYRYLPYSITGYQHKFIRPVNIEYKRVHSVSQLLFNTECSLGSSNSAIQQLTIGSCFFFFTIFTVGS